MVKWLEEGLTDYVPSHKGATSAYKVEIGAREEARKIHGELTLFNEKDSEDEWLTEIQLPIE